MSKCVRLCEGCAIWGQGKAWLAARGWDREVRISGFPFLLTVTRFCCIPAQPAHRPPLTRVHFQTDLYGSSLVAPSGLAWKEGHFLTHLVRAFQGRISLADEDVGPIEQRGEASRRGRSTLALPCKRFAMHVNVSQTQRQICC